MREFYILGIIIVGLAMLPMDAMAQRKRVPAKPATTAAPVPPPRQLSPAEAFFQAGLKCEADDHDCKISNYTKAINLELKTHAVYKNRGTAYLAKLDLEKAIADFTKCIEIDPNDVNGFKLRGRSFLLIRNPESYSKALVDFTSAVELEPKDIEAINLRGLAFSRLSSYEKALAEFDKSILIDPANAEAYANRSDVLRFSGELDKALDAISKAIARNATNYFYVLTRSRIYSSLKKPDLAIQDLTRAIEIDGTRYEAYSERADVYMSSGKHDEAVADYSKALERNQKAAGYFWAKRGSAYLALEKDDLAMADFNKSIETDPDSRTAFELRGALNLKLKNYDAAIEDSKKAFTIFPNTEDAYSNLALAIAGKEGRFNDVAQGYFTQSNLNRITNATAQIRRDPKSIEAYKKRAAAYVATESYGEAVADYTKLIEFEPTNAAAYVGRAGAYSGMKVYNKSADDYTKAIELEPNNIVTLSARATNYLVFLKDMPRAESDYLRMISLHDHSESTEVYYVSALRNISTIYGDQKRIDDALAVLNKAIEEHPTSGEILAVRAEFYSSKANRPALAVEDYLKAIDLAPARAEIYYGLANAYNSQKNQPAAIAILARAVETNPTDPLAYYYRGLFNWIGISKYAEAINDFTKCNELAANDNPYKEACRLSVTNAQASQQREIANQAAAAAAREREREAARKRRADTVLTIMKGISDGLATPRRP